MASKVNKELFLENLKNKHGDKVELLSEFYGKEKKVDIVYHCEKHGDTITSLNAKNIFGNNFNPCKECLKDKHSQYKHSKKDKKYFYEKLKECCSVHNGNVIETKWTKAKDTYHFKCENPNHPVFANTADGIMSKKQWCPYRSGRKGNFNTKINNIIRDKNGTKLSEYKNSTTPIWVQCNKDGHIWSVLPCNLQKGRWCPVCNMPFTEKTVWDYLQNNNIETQIQYKFDDLENENHEKLKFDFAIFYKNKLEVLLEIDDVEHYFNHPKCIKRQKAKKRDIQKDEYCKENNIPLYRMRVPFRNGDKNEMNYSEYYEYIHIQLYPIISNYINNKDGEEFGIK